MSTIPDDVEPASADELGEAQSRISNLEIALDSSRTIGMAIGIVMERRKLTADDAFEHLQTISKRANRKVRDIAADIVFTGIVPEESD